MKALFTLLLLLAVAHITTAQITINSSCENQALCVEEDNCGPLPLNISIEASTVCSTSILSYTYSLDYDDNGIIDIIGSTSVVGIDLPIGSHRIIFTVSDGCGESETCSYLLLVEDCTPPEVITPGVIVVALTDAGSLTLEAASLNFNNSDNCGITQFLIHSPSLGSDQLIPPTAATSSWMYNCDDLGLQSIDLWVGDDNDNWAYYSTSIVIQDDFQTCDSETEVELCVWALTECDELIDSISVDIMTGGSNSVYTFQSINSCETIAPHDYLNIDLRKDINPKNGVSTLDMLLISKHLLGILDIPSPYRQLAADVNFSGAITTYDMILIRQLLLDHIDAFPGNRSWRFVISDFVFPNVDNPFETSIPATLNINDLNEDAYLEFTGIKLGDVNKSADPSELASNETEDRSTKFINIVDQSFEANEKIQVDFTLTDLERLSGFQFALKFDPEILSFRYSTSGILSDFGEANLGLAAIEKGLMKSSWIDKYGQATAISDEVLFSLFFDAKRAGKLSEVLRLLPTPLHAEAYDADLNISNLALTFEPENTSANLQTQVVPNPMNEATTLLVDVPTTTQGTLQILAGDGRRIKNLNLDLTKGSNVIPLQFDEKMTKGIFLYRLTTKDGKSISGKIIKQ